MNNNIFIWTVEVSSNATFATHISNNIFHIPDIHAHIYTTAPSVNVTNVYKCTIVHITPDLMIMLRACNKQHR